MHPPDEFLPEFYTGEPVEPRDLWYREAFIEQLWATLQKRHVLLSAPRRTGKTSVMIHLKEHPQHGFMVVYQNVQDLKHPADLFQTILDNFHDVYPDTLAQMGRGGLQWLKDVLAKVDSVGAGGFKVALRKSDVDWKTNWRQHGDELLAELRRLGVPVLLIVDELPDMILNVRAIDEPLAKEFVAWLRVNRQTPRPGQDPIRWLLGGSINLAGTLDEMGELDAINDVAVESLPVLLAEEVHDFVRRMLKSVSAPFHADVPLQVARRLGQPIPLFMQLATQDLHRQWRRNPRELTTVDVDAVFEALVMSQAAYDKLQHYYSRIDKYYREPNETAAYEMLSALAVSGEQGLSLAALNQIYQQALGQLGMTLPSPQRKQAFNRLMRDLENDFYIREISDGQFDFASGLMKAWWKKYYA